MKKNKEKKAPRILCLDIETAPMVIYNFSIGYDQNIGLDQVIEDWHLLSFAARFVGESKMHYADQRNAKDISNDKPLLEKLHALLCEADVVLGQNVQNFDIKRINARMLIHGMQPPSSYKVIDTLKIVKRKFAMTSNKLEYLSKKLCTHKKSSHKKFPGLSLWKECLKGNKSAFKEMEHYNKQDVIATEELYSKLSPWDNSFNPNVYSELTDTVCTCGSTKFVKNGHAYTPMGKFARFKCSDCGKEVRSRENLLSKEKRKSLRK